MVKNKKVLISFSVIFILVQAALGYILQTTSSSFNYRYLAIVLSCAFCFLFYERSKSYFFTQLALVFTVCADYFLVYLDEIQQLTGMLFFCGTQIAYFLRIFFEEKSTKIRKIHLIIRITLTLVVLLSTFIVLKDATDMLALVSMFYYTNLVLNIVFSFVQFKNLHIMAAGLVCFLLCDTIIGLDNLGPYLKIPDGSWIYKLLNSNVDIAWLFYIPSQALLSISLLTQKIKKRV